MATTSNKSSRWHTWHTAIRWSDHDVRNGVGAFVLSAANAAVFAGIIELVLLLIDSNDEAESVGAPGLDGTPPTATQLMYLHVATLFRRLALLVPPLAAVLATKAAALSTPNRRIASNVISVCMAVLALLALAFAVAFVVTYRDTSRYTELLTARDPHVVATFNSYYCNSRGTVWCANNDDDTFATLIKWIGSSGETNSSREPMLRVFRSCQHVLVANRGGLSTRQTQFLATCNTSDAVDAWCGNALAQRPVLTIDNDAAPASINSAKFAHFAAAWSSRHALDGVLLLFVVLLVAVLVGMWRAVPDVYTRLEPCELLQVLAAHLHAADPQPITKPLVTSAVAAKTK